MHLIILDRDGVINHDSDDYIKSVEEWRPIDGSLEAIARLCRAEYRVVIATNQSAVGRGLIDMDQLNHIHKHMLDQIHEKGGEIDAIFFCPHTPDDDCDCRKPKPGMLQRIAERSNNSLEDVPMVGDSSRDLLAAQAAGAFPVMVLSGKNEFDVEPGEKITNDTRFSTVPTFSNLASFTDALLDGRLIRYVSH